MTYDLVIVGAGPAGLSFARALGESGLDIAVLERRDVETLADPPFDGREIALTHLSGQILRELGIWRHIAADEISVIRRARILNGNSPYHLNFDRNQTAKDFLGHVAPNHLIRRAAYQSLREVSNVEILDQAEVTSISSDRKSARIGLADGRGIECRLVVAADSRFSETRRMMGIPARSRDFGRICIVCRMAHEVAHHDTAYECFHYRRTLAVIPLVGKKSSIVITLPSERADAVMAMDAAEFDADITRRFARRFGAMRLLGDRHAYPLVAVYADRFHATRFALIGDAAVGMHPVTAHGFNLGLRGAVTLANEIKAAIARKADFAARDVLARYHHRHDRVARPIYLGTNTIVRLYTDDRMAARMLRRLLLRLGNHVPPARRAILNRLTEVPSLTS